MNFQVFILTWFFVGLISAVLFTINWVYFKKNHTAFTDFPTKKEIAKCFIIVSASGPIAVLSVAVVIAMDTSDDRWFHLLRQTAYDFIISIDQAGI